MGGAKWEADGVGFSEKVVGAMGLSRGMEGLIEFKYLEA